MVRVKRAEKYTYNPMELTPLIALWSSQMILRLPCAKLAEILRSFGNHISEELEFDTSERFACLSIISFHSC